MNKFKTEYKPSWVFLPILRKTKTSKFNLETSQDKI